MLPIEGLKKFSFKSFKDFSTDTDNYFSLNNYFYGENGEGKSSLLLRIRQICIDENIRYEYYSKDFVNKILSLEDDYLQGVKLTLGEENVQVKVELQEKKKQKTELESQYNISNLTKKLDDDFSEFSDKYAKIFNIQKGSTKIKKKQLRLESIEDIISSHQQEVNVYKSKFKTDVLSVSANNEIYEQNIQSLKSVSDLTNLRYIVDWDNLKIILNTEFELLNIDHSVLKWIESGIELHDDDRTVECKFCKSEFNATQRISELNQMISNETKKKQDELNAIKKTLEIMSTTVSQMTIDVQCLLSNEIYSEKYNFFKDTKVNVLDCIKSVTQLIVKKLDNMKNNMTYEFDLVQTQITILNDTINELNEIKQQIINDNENALKKLNDIAKYKVANAVVKDTELSLLIKSISDTDKKIREYNSKLAIINDEIRKITSKSSDVSDTAELINTSLKHANINIELIIDDDNYRLRMRSDSTINLKIENISEGEKGLIAFLYWYFQLFKKIGEAGKEKLNDEIKVVIIDDPICSLDNKNNTYLITLINNIIKYKKFQIFIAFHEWRDFINLIFGKSNENHKIMAIKKYNGISKIVDLKAKDSLYKRMYKEIHEINEKETLDSEDILKAPNYIRRCLETYLRFNYGIQLATEKTENDIIDRLDVSNKQKMNFSTLLKVCNIFSHGDAFLYEPSENEVKTAIKCFVTVMENKDKNHHYIMIGN